MSEDEFSKLFKYMQAEFKVINDKLDGKASTESMEALTRAIDAYAKKVDDYVQEMLMLAHKVDRLERWINQLAAKTGVKLEY
jgi:hypothetical protein